MSDEENCQAIVEKVIAVGPHGPYAVASCPELGSGSITFSLDTTVWKESDWPEPGMCVVLSQMRKKRAGWRAKSGRFVKPSDEQQPNNSKEQRA